MMLVKKIQSLFDSNKDFNPNKDLVVNCVLDLGKYYVVTMVLKNTPKDDFLVDNLYRIDYAIKKISVFHLDMDRSKYLEALKNPIYLRPST